MLAIGEAGATVAVVVVVVACAKALLIASDQIANDATTYLQDFID
jgi:hypothetical protein